jgi:hypothetical protein
MNPAFRRSVDPAAERGRAKDDLPEDSQYFTGMVVQDVLGATPCKPVMHKAHEVSNFAVISHMNL